MEASRIGVPATGDATSELERRRPSAIEGIDYRVVYQYYTPHGA